MVLNFFEHALQFIVIKKHAIECQMSDLIHLDSWNVIGPIISLPESSKAT